MKSPVALITGSAQRIGAVLVNQLHQLGYNVMIHYHQSQTAAETLAAGFNQLRAHSAIAVAADLCGSAASSVLVEAAIAHWGRLDVLVNNASIFSNCDSEWESMWRCNVQAPYYLSYAAFPHLETTHGSIINITDIHAHKPLRGYAAYCQTKAALAMQTRALAQEFAPKVRVNAIAPGAILWPQGANQLNSVHQAKIIKQTLLKQHGHPEQIAQAMLYLMHNAYVTGQSLQVDGGRHL